MTSKEQHDLELNLIDYLKGMRRVNREAMDQIAAIDDWGKRAEEELRRRVASRTLACIDDQTLAAIASGHVNLQELADQYKLG